MEDEDEDSDADDESYPACLVAVLGDADVDESSDYISQL